MSAPDLYPVRVEYATPIPDIYEPPIPWKWGPEQLTADDDRRVVMIANYRPQIARRMAAIRARDQRRALAFGMQEIKTNGPGYSGQPVTCSLISCDHHGRGCEHPDRHGISPRSAYRTPWYRGTPYTADTRS